MKIVTDHVFPNEGSWGLFEGPRMMPMPGGGQAWRWVQAVYVIRDDAIAEYASDLGSAEDFADVQPLLMPGFGDDSVAEVQGWAEKNRHDSYWARRVEEMLAESTLIPDALRQKEMQREAIRNRSVIGPAVTVQRNEYPRQLVQRELKEKTHG